MNVVVLAVRCFFFFNYTCYSLSIVFEHFTWHMCVRFFVSSWKPTGKRSVGHSLTTFIFSHDSGILLCCFFPLEPTTHTTLPTYQLTPVIGRHHRHLGSILFKLHQLNKELFKRITKIHRAKSNAIWACLQQFLMKTLNLPPPIFSHTGLWLLSLSGQNESCPSLHFPPCIDYVWMSEWSHSRRV